MNQKNRDFEEHFAEKFPYIAELRQSELYKSFLQDSGITPGDIITCSTNRDPTKRSSEGHIDKIEGLERIFPMKRKEDEDQIVFTDLYNNPEVRTIMFIDYFNLNPERKQFSVKNKQTIEGVLDAGDKLETWRKDKREQYQIAFETLKNYIMNPEGLGLTELEEDGNLARAAITSVINVTEKDIKQYENKFKQFQKKQEEKVEKLEDELKDSREHYSESRESILRFIVGLDEVQSITNKPESLKDAIKGIEKEFETYNGSQKRIKEQLIIGLIHSESYSEILQEVMKHVESANSIAKGIDTILSQYSQLEKELQKKEKENQDAWSAITSEAKRSKDLEIQLKEIERQNAGYEDLKRKYEQSLTKIDEYQQELQNARKHESNSRSATLQERIDGMTEFWEKVGTGVKKAALVGTLLTALFAGTYTLGYGVWHKLTVGELAEHIGKGFPGK